MSTSIDVTTIVFIYFCFTTANYKPPAVSSVCLGPLEPFFVLSLNVTIYRAKDVTKGKKSLRFFILVLSNTYQPN